MISARSQHHHQPTDPTTTAIQHLGSKVRLKDPDVFTGESCDQQVVDSWLRCMERHRDFFNWDSARTVTFAVTYLRDYADTWYRSLEEADDAPTVWDDFKHVFTDRFRPDNAYDLARDKLHELRQTTTLKDYVQQFTSTIILIPELHHLEGYDKFMRGIKPANDKLFAELRSVPVSERSLDLAYRKALAYEASHVRRDSNGKVISALPTMPTQPIQRRYDAMELDFIQNQQSYYHSNNNGHATSSSWRGNRGSGRGGRGANRGNSNTSYTYKNNNSYNNNGQYTSSYCKLCKRSGHPVTSCPLLDTVISVLDRGRNNSGSSVNVINNTALDQEDPSIDGSIQNKNIHSNYYSHMPAFSIDDNTRNISVPTTDPIVEKVAAQSSPTSSSLLPVDNSLSKTRRLQSVPKN